MWHLVARRPMRPEPGGVHKLRQVSVSQAQLCAACAQKQKNLGASDAMNKEIVHEVHAGRRYRADVSSEVCICEEAVFGEGHTWGGAQMPARHSMADEKGHRCNPQVAEVAGRKLANDSGVPVRPSF